MDQCSATSLKRSRRELSIDVAELRSILKNDQDTYYPRFSFTPKTGIELPETGVLFLLCTGGVKKYTTLIERLCSVVTARLPFKPNPSPPRHTEANFPETIVSSQ